MGKVLQFPSNYKPENPPQVDTSAAETRENFAWAEQLAEGIMYSCLKNLQQNGVNIVDESTVSQLSFLGEVVRSVVQQDCQEFQKYSTRQTKSIQSCRQ